DFRPGDPDLLPADHERAVVEVAPDQVGAARAVRPDRGERDQQGDGEQAGQYEEDAPHGPSGWSVAVQSFGGAGLVRPLPGQSGATNGFERSSAGWVVPPGQRRKTWKLEEGAPLVAVHAPLLIDVPGYSGR